MKGPILPLRERFHFPGNGVYLDFAEFDPHLAAPKTPRIWSLSTESESEGYFGA
jgi:hypothetical protein